MTRITDRYLQTVEPETNKKLLSIRLETNLSAQIRRNSKGQITRSFVFRSVLSNGKAFSEYLGSVSDLTIAEARKLAQERREILRQGYKPKDFIQSRLNEKLQSQKKEQKTARYLLELYLQKRNNLSATTKQAQSVYIRYIEPFLDVPLSEIAQTRIPFELVNQCVQHGYYAKAVRIAGLIYQLCETGIDYNLLDNNPFTRLKRIIPDYQPQHLASVRPEYIREDISKLFSMFLRGRLNRSKMFFLVGFFTLLRPREVEGLKKANLNTTEHTLFIEHTKTLKNGWTIQTNAILEKLLSFVDKKYPKDVKFIQRTQTSRTVNDFFTAHHVSFKCHGWRAAGMSWLVQNGISVTVANAVLTHKIGEAVTLAYMRSDLPNERKKALYIWNRFLLRVLYKSCPNLARDIFKTVNKINNSKQK